MPPLMLVLLVGSRCVCVSTGCVRWYLTLPCCVCQHWVCVSTGCVRWYCAQVTVFQVRNRSGPGRPGSKFNGFTEDPNKVVLERTATSAESPFISTTSNKPVSEVISKMVVSTDYQELGHNLYGILDLQGKPVSFKTLPPFNTCM